MTDVLSSLYIYNILYIYIYIYIIYIYIYVYIYVICLLSLISSIMLDRTTAMGNYVTMTAADLGFNFRGCAMSRAHEYK